MNPIQIGKGHVYHSRKEGASNSFRYPTFYLYFRCDQESELKTILRNRFRRFLSFSIQDYLKGEAGTLLDSAKTFIRENCGYEADEIWLHTMPRMLGYAFNPVSFWLCHRNGKLEAALVEVNNTFHERHFYWIHPKEKINPDSWYRAEKVFHVSPFFPVEGFYQFRFQTSALSTRVDINYHNPNGKLRLATWVSGQMFPLQTQSLLGLFAAYGWMTPMVVLRIHFQAMKLFLKKSRFYSKPELPQGKVSS